MNEPGFPCFRDKRTAWRFIWFMCWWHDFTGSAFFRANCIKTHNRFELTVYSNPLFTFSGVKISPGEKYSPGLLSTNPSTHQPCSCSPLIPLFYKIALVTWTFLSYLTCVPSFNTRFYSVLRQLKRYLTTTLKPNEAIQLCNLLRHTEPGVPRYTNIG